MFCCFQYVLHQAMGPGVAASCGNDAHDFRAACSSIAQRNLRVFGALVTVGGKLLLREWKQSFFWLLTNICHTFLLLVPYSWSHQAIMKDGMDRQVSSAVAWDLTLQLIISSLCRMWCVGTTGILGSGFTLHPVFPMAAADRLLIFLLINQNNFEEKIRGSFPIHSSP